MVDGKGMRPQKKKVHVIACIERHMWRPVGCRLVEVVFTITPSASPSHSSPLQLFNTPKSSN